MTRSTRSSRVASVPLDVAKLSVAPESPVVNERRARKADTSGDDDGNKAQAQKKFTGQDMLRQLLLLDETNAAVKEAQVPPARAARYPIGSRKRTDDSVGSGSDFTDEDDDTGKPAGNLKDDTEAQPGNNVVVLTPIIRT